MNYLRKYCSCGNNINNNFYQNHRNMHCEDDIAVSIHQSELISTKTDEVLTYSIATIPAIGNQICSLR